MRRNNMTLPRHIKEMTVLDALTCLYMGDYSFVNDKFVEDLNQFDVIVTCQHCEYILLPDKYTMFEPLEYEEEMPKSMRNGWVELVVRCFEENCGKGSRFVDVPLPDDKEEYDLFLQVLGQDPEDWHAEGTRFLKLVK